MLRGVKFDHIACAVRKVSDGFRLLRRFQARPLKGGNDKQFRGGQWIMPNNSVLELIEPAESHSEEENFLYRFLRKHGAGVHHITFIVPSIKDAIERASALGLEVLKYNETKPHWKEVFLHPKQSLGTLIQLAEYNPHLKVKNQAWDAQWDGFEGYPPRDVSPDPRLLGLQGLNILCNVEHLTLAEKIFRQLLGGERREAAFPHISHSRHHVYYWEESSPLTISMNIELYRDTKEGPFAIEMLVTRDYDEGALKVPEIGALFIPLFADSLNRNK